MHHFAEHTYCKPPFTTGLIVVGYIIRARFVIMWSPCIIRCFGTYHNTLSKVRWQKVIKLDPGLASSPEFNISVIECEE